MVTIDAPREAVWRLVGDLAQHPRFLSDVTRFEREGEKKTGLGARYNVRFRLGSAHAGGLVEVVEYDEPWELAWNSVRGFDHRIRWRLRDAGASRTQVTLRLLYRTPGLGDLRYGLAGLVVDNLAAPLVGRIVSRTLDNLKRLIADDAGIPDQPSALDRVADGLESLNILRQAGLVRALPPDVLLRLGFVLRSWGLTPAAGYTLAATIFPNETAVIDELGELTFAEVEERSNALARGLREEGVDTGTPVGVMARNHRWFIEAVVALWKLGATVVLLNTSFAGPQLADVARREELRFLIYDEEFEALVAGAARGRRRVIAWPETADPAKPTLEKLIEANDGHRVAPPEHVARTVILTSGTSGRPKGAGRSNPSDLDPALSLLSVIPLRQRETTLIAAPLFHSWGFSHFTLGLLLSSTYVLQRRFSPEAVLRVIEQTRPDALVAVPVMLQRILELPARIRRRHDTSSLRVVAISGSALPGELARRWMDEFGDNLYNLYGSTEVAWATIATPADLRAAPGTAGRPPRHTVVRIYGNDGREVPIGATGRIFVGNQFQFEGYTGGGGKEEIGGLLASGDVGHFDADGRLFVDGRDDEMIVSGGENVYPREVEDLLAGHPKVGEVAVIGIPDQEFGQALKAVIVARGELSPNEVKDYVRSNLARYKVPRQVEFVKELPRNPTGKVLKRELAGANGRRRRTKAS